jgi:hypothetical protein
MDEKSVAQALPSVSTEWQRLIGQGVKTPDGDWGSIVKQAGEWDVPERRGWFVVAVPGRGQRVYHVCELELLGTLH